MKNCSVLASASVALFAALIVGCAKPPEQELQTAKASLDSALTVQADKYAASDFAAAKESLDGAVAEINKQNAASAMKRDYTQAKAMLATATTSANTAKTKAAEGKQQAIADANGALTNATALLTEVKGLVEKLPKAKKAEKEKMKGEVTAAETTLGEAQTANGSGDYITARDKANACIAKLDAIKTTLAPAPKAAATEKKVPARKRHK